MRYLIRILLFGLIFSQLARPQEISNPRPDYQYGAPLFRAEVGVVNVSVVVLGRNNRPLPRLGKQNFKVEERKVGEKIFREIEINMDLPEYLPLRGGVNIDTSGSIAPQQFRYQLDVASELAKRIIREISDKKRGDKFFAAEFYYEALDQNPTQGIFTLKQDWTDDVRALVGAIVRKTKKAAGASPLFGSVRMSTEKFRNEPGNFANFLIVVGDGQNNLPFSGLKDSAHFAQSANLPIYTIGTVSHQKVDPMQVSEFERNLKEISRLTGGRFFDLPRLEKLPEIARQILLDLRNQYHLSYKLNPDYKDGDEIQVAVEVGNTDPNGKWQKMPTRLLYRNGYRVTKND